jgi:hypothetical protein
MWFKGFLMGAFKTPSTIARCMARSCNFPVWHLRDCGRHQCFDPVGAPSPQDAKMDTPCQLYDPFTAVSAKGCPPRTSTPLRSDSFNLVSVHHVVVTCLASVTLERWFGPVTQAQICLTHEVAPTIRITYTVACILSHVCAWVMGCSSGQGWVFCIAPQAGWCSQLHLGLSPLRHPSNLNAPLHDTLPRAVAFQALHQAAQILMHGFWRLYECAGAMC